MKEVKRELYSYSKKLNNFLSSGQISELQKAISIFAPVAETIKNDARDILSESNNGQSKRRDIGNRVRQAIAQEKGLNYRTLIVQVHAFESLLNEYPLIKSSEGSASMSELLDLIDDFMSKYDSHNRSYTENSFIPLSVTALELQALLSTVWFIAKDKALTKECNTVDSYVSLDLYLANVTTLKSFAAKLGAVDEIYTELLHLYGESTTEFPIIIEHIENGSLWIKIAGHSLTSTALAIIMTSAANYYQDNFTVSGQLKNLPSSVQAANELLKISAVLEKDGIDTTQIKDNIASATRKMSRQLDNLLGDQPAVEVNDKVLRLNDINSQKLIEASMKNLPHHDLQPNVNDDS
ncbi:hypothetical protein [Vibrio cyclitrophicus]|uniref:hypothetical protein n=1 Tax=Vibrio cyclitrophicus TaxID=47951 RepID=UPI000C83146F|nr:hypothetical protein [Vibrio cyclitrophicus]PMJ73730.1 hypothetical protein BCU15_21280 [Vibrio cyclitrophicus]